MIYQRKAGTTDVSVVIRIIDSGDGTPETGVTSATGGIDLEYRREGAVVVNITETDLSALTDAHSDGGLLHITGGYYRLDLPDAAVAAGSTGVLVAGTITGMVVIGCYVQLVAYDPFDTVRLGLTALPNAAADAAGGLIISDAGGLDADAQRADIDNIQTRLPAALTASGNIKADLQAVQTNDDAASGLAELGVEYGLNFLVPAHVSTIANNAINAATIATDAIDNDAIANSAVTEIQAGLATAANLATALTDLDNIQTRLPAALTAAGNIKADMEEILQDSNAVAGLSDIGTEYTLSFAIPANVSTITNNAITAASIATGAIDADAIADNAIDAGALAANAIAAIQSGLSTLTQANVRTAVGLTSANLDTQLAALPTAVENADAALSRGVSNVEDTADTTSLAAIILAILESSVSGTAWTIRKTDGSTFVIKTVTPDAAAVPITGVT